jgi:hypothetical protein
MFPHSGPVTSLSTLLDESVKRNLMGRQVILAEVVVREVLDEEIFLIGSGDTVPVIVLGELTARQRPGVVRLRAGQQVRIFGTVRLLRSADDLAELAGLDPAAARRLAGHQIYISALRVTAPPMEERERLTEERERMTELRERMTEERERTMKERERTMEHRPEPAPPARAITSVAQLVDPADVAALQGRPAMLDRVRVTRVLGDYTFLVGDDNASIVVALYGEMTHRQSETAVVVRAGDELRIFGTVWPMRDIDDIEDRSSLSADEIALLRGRGLYISAARVVHLEPSS